MKTLLAVITSTILFHQTRPQGCETSPPRVYCSDVTLEKGKPLQTGNNNSGIEEIYVFDCTIPSIPSGIFSNFTNVTEIFLQVGAFTIEPGAFNGVADVKILNLRHNNFTVIPNDVLTKLTKLKLLDLGYNKIIEITPGSLNLPSSLEILHLTWNGLRAIKPRSLDSLVNLRDLYLNHNFISKIQPGTLNSLTNLVNLNLEHNIITKVDRYTFKNLSNLEYLYLGSNALGRGVIEQDTFKYLPKLIVLDLQYNYLKKLEPELFRNLQSLATLQLKYNQLTFISKKILDGLPKLKVLLIDNNKITSLDAESVLISLPNLVHISLNNNSLECGSLPKTVEVFENHNVTVIRNHMKTYSNVYGINCVCNSEQQASSDLNTHIPIQGCKTVNNNIDKGAPGGRGSVNTSRAENSETVETLNLRTEQNASTAHNNSDHLKKFQRLENGAVAMESTEKPETINSSTEQIVVKTQLQKFEKAQEDFSSKQDATVNVIAIVMSVIACVVLIALVVLYVHHRKKLNILRNFIIKSRDVDLMSENTELGTS